MTVNKWLKRNTDSLLGRTVAISGSTGGIGRELCDLVAGLGASLILVDRNRKKSEALAESLKAKYPSLSVEYVTADMSDIESVKAAADALLLSKVDFLILNAGAYAIPREVCSTGLGNVFQINFVSPYYLARRLFPLIKERGGRIIAVSSIAHNYSESDPDDIDFSKRKRASQVYGNAKRYLTYSLMDIFAESDTLAIAHPGIAFTGITSHYPKPVFFIIKYPMKVIFMRPRKAALSVLMGIFTPTGKDSWIGPRLFNVWGLPGKKKLLTANDGEIRRISETAEKIYNNLV